MNGVVLRVFGSKVIFSSVGPLYIIPIHVVKDTTPKISKQSVRVGEWTYVSAGVRVEVTPGFDGLFMYGKNR